MVEIELKKILTNVSELENKVFMLTAPELTKSPYVVYTMTNSEEEYILDGITGNRTVSFDINIYSKDTIQLKNLAYRTKENLLNLLGTNLGGFLIQSVRTYMTDFYDSNISMYRSVIELEIHI